MSLAVKSGRPLPREGFVRRPRLLAKLIAGRDIPLVTLVAPAGYGKTYLLAEWAEEEERPSVWLTLERWHDEPLRLTREIVASLADVELVEDGFLKALHHPHPDLSSQILPALASAIEALTVPLALILDDAHVLTSPGAWEVLSTIAHHVPPGSQLVLASRTHPALPMGRLRVQRALLELGASEMAMERVEAASLLRTAHLRVDSAKV